MEIKIRLNSMELRYDIYQIVNLFYDFMDINFVNEEWDYYFEFSKDRFSITKKDGYKEEFLLECNDYHNYRKAQIKKDIFKYFQKITGRELPWGTLVGIRPSKIALNLLKDGKNKIDIEKYFYEQYLCRADKADLCIEIAKLEDKLVNTESKTVSVYVGMPFCPTRCLYCSFTSNPIISCKNIVEDYLKALNFEIEETSKYIRNKGLKIQCVYFGGGTPTSVNEEQFRYIMNSIHNNYIKGNNVEEFTVESGRPDSITEDKLNTMKKYNVHRISINPQTMNDSTLKSIGRNHSVDDVIEKFKLARSLNFDNINMDIIVGLIGEGIDEIRNTCSEIFKLAPDSITVHGLSIKRGSRLYENMVNNYKLKPVNQEELNSMYEATVTLSKKLGMNPYYMYRQKNMIGNMENIGYALKGKEGIYNIQMIEERQTIIAVGADAVSKVVFLDEDRIERAANVKDVREYINRVKEMVDKKIELLDTLYK